MHYEVFPFGKYKGVKLEELPSTYIIHALESFELSNEFFTKLYFILLGRFKTFTRIKELVEQSTKKEAIELLNDKIETYE